MQKTTRFIVLSLLIYGFNANANQEFCYNQKSSNPLISKIQDRFFEECEFKLPCGELPATEMVSCLQAQSSLNLQLRNDPYLNALVRKDPGTLIMFLKKPPIRNVVSYMQLKDLYQADSGVREGYSIAQHTTMALIVLESQLPFLDLSKAKDPDIVRDKVKFIKHLVTYHDIGKSISERLYSNNSKEIEYSYPIAWRLMLASKFSRAESRFAISLIAMHKEIGDFLQDKLSLEEIKNRAEPFVKLSGVSKSNFLKYLEILFVADAGSYPYLRKNIFVQDETGKLLIKDEEKIQKLRAAFQ